MSLSCNTPTHSCLIHKQLRNVFCRNVGEMVFLDDTHSSFYYVYDDEFNDQFINSLQKIRTFVKSIAALMSSIYSTY